MKKIIITADIYLIEDFLSDKECDDLIRFSENEGYEEAKVNIDGKQKLVTMIRNNQRVLHFNDTWASLYWEKLNSFPQKPIESSFAIGLNELFRFYRYTPEQRFKKHRDGSHVKNEEERSKETFMVYLNDDFEGGKTLFLENEIIPKKGTALVFRHELKHEGQKVISGTKYVLRSDIMHRIITN